MNNLPIASVDVSNARPKVILNKSLSIVPRAQRTEIFYRPNYRVQDDAIAKDFNILYENGLFTHNDQETSLKMIFDKIAIDYNESNAWTNKSFNLDVIRNTNVRISARKVSLESLKADTELSKTNKATVKSLISMLKRIKTKPDDFNVSYIISNHKYILLKISKFRLTKIKD